MKLAESDDEFVFNGIDADTSEYLFSSTNSARIARWIRGDAPDPDPDGTLAARHNLETDEHYGVSRRFRPDDLSSVGWALVAADDTDPAIIDALEPLRNHRRAQAGSLYRELSDVDGVHSDESEQDFLIDRGVDSMDVADPRQPVLRATRR